MSFVQSNYNPGLYQSLELQDSTVDADKVEETPFGCLLSTPSNLIWQMGNCFNVYTEYTVPSSCSVPNLEFIKYVENILHEPRFIIYDALEESQKSQQVKGWKELLLSDGYKEEYDVSHCMGISPELLLSRPLQHKVTNISLDNLNECLSIDTEKGFANEEWRRIRVKKQIERNPSLIYLCWDGNGNPVARVSMFIDKDNIGFVTRLDTLPTERRKGYGRDVLQYALEDLFRTYSCKSCYLFQVDEGAQRFYENLGFEMIDSRAEHVFVKQAA
ncbi:hypothetical protein HDV02_001446 [Globomyces sp. JEL0801]|nr:hypothetical protein HDV02_001446 [Globomyces sp. JEL0801]